MNIHDFVKKTKEAMPSIDIKEENLIFTSQQHLKQIGDCFQIDIKEMMKHNDDFAVFFKPGLGYDLFSFIYFKKTRKHFAFEKVSMILLHRSLIVVMENQGFYQEIQEELGLDFNMESIISAYFCFLDLAFSGMFSSLCRQEEHLNQVEIRLLTNNKECKMEGIISEKNSSLKIKKYTKLLLYAGEDLKLNLNHLIPEKELKLFKSLHAKLNLLNEMSNHLYEISTHLLEVYDSAVGTKTNNMINKLTIFSFFATPITMLSGIYGMNFINMPELRSQYGYYILLIVMLLITFSIYKILKRVKLL